MAKNSSVENDVVMAMDDPFSGSSLVPMLVSGLVLIVVGMIAVAAFS
jgi:hypothetical protein